MKLSRGHLIAAGLVVLTLVGFVFLRGPTPAIAIKPETIYSFGRVNVTNTMITSWVVVAIIIIAVFLATRRWDLVPRGAQNFVEWLFLEGEFIIWIIRVPFLNYEVTESLAGERNARRFFPLVATIFFFVLACNWLSLLPVFNAIGVSKQEEHGFVMEQAEVGPLDVTYLPFSSPKNISGDTIDEDDPEAREKLEKAREDGKFVGELLPLFRGAATDLNTPLALAIASFIAVETWGIMAMGFFTYGRKFVNLGTFFRGIARLNFGMLFQGMIDAFVGLLELVSELVRLISFTARLFGNLFAGEVVILMFTFLTPLFLTLPFYGLELFVGFIQAYIFGILTLVFGLIAVRHGEGHAAEEEHEEEAGALAPEASG